MRRCFTNPKVKSTTIKPKYLTIKSKCLIQNGDFKRWASHEKWATFHSAHYDWWAFPINKPSSYGSAYQVGAQQFFFLSKDEQFIQALRTNAILVCRAWGWDLKKGKKIVTKNKDQRWQNWPVRLYKMSLSLEIFQQNDLLKNSIKYGNVLLDEKNYFMFRKVDLGEFFQERRHICEGNKKVEE